MSSPKLRQKRIEGFLVAVRASEKGKAARKDDRIATGTLDILSDDELVHVIEALLELPPDLFGLKYIEAARKTHRAVSAFALTCGRVASVLRALAPRQQAEAIARAAAAVVPVDRAVPLPFTLQMKAELASVDQLRLTRCAVKAMACHCAQKCCQRYQRLLNKDLRRGNVLSNVAEARSFRLVSALDTCNLIAAAPDGDAVFAYVRCRLSKIGVHGEGRGRRYQDRLLRLQRTFVDGEPTFRVEQSVDVDFEDCSPPLSMRASSDGLAVAYVCSEHADSEALSTASVWRAEWPAPQAVPLEGVCSSAQDAWFIGSDVVVAASTGFVHPSGHALGEDTAASSGYVFASFEVEGGKLSPGDLGTETVGRMLVTCSTTHGGERVLALAKRQAAPGGRYCRSIFIHDVLCDGELMVPQSIAAAARGPVAASISPSGDAISTLHFADNSLVLRIAVSNSGGVFTPVQQLDMSPWLGLSPFSDRASAAGPDLVKAGVHVSFSPCGRFVALVDRRPLFGDAPLNHGVVTVNLAARMESKKLRPLPLIGTADQAPRQFEWTKGGIYLCAPATDENNAIGPRGGLLCLCNHVHCAEAEAAVGACRTLATPQRAPQ